MQYNFNMVAGLETPKKEVMARKIISPKNRIVRRRKAKRSRLKRRIFKHVWIVRLSILLGAMLLILLVSTLLSSRVENSDTSLYISLAKNFITKPTQDLVSANGRTNILILGKGGAGHEAPDLTDTILIASFALDNPEIVLVSLPRDIWIEDLRTKLNSVYYWGEQKQVGGGAPLTKSIVEDIVGVPIHYTLVVEFENFKKIINTVGGLEVQIENSFVDDKYPVKGKEADECMPELTVQVRKVSGKDIEFSCRYETISFEKGLVYMDGETALKYVRSRNADGDEGTDFARVKRQQQLIKALQNKLTSKEFLMSLGLVKEVIDLISSNIQTYIEPTDVAILARLAYDGRENVKSYTIDEEFLVNPEQSSMYDNLYVFLPKGETWEEVQRWYRGLFD